ncbi:MAG: LicD family protein, partial [Lachnospiraceae bacterium]|nr:LicD family protein [Candidatus Merdinaster equi]
MGFDKSYLEDEVREGFYVPAIMKQCWASQLTVLEEVDKLCERHQIQYFAEWGSLLGAVRHGGFIPWDDDLDIVMKRDDYERFMRFHGELPKGFEVQTYRNREGYIQFITNVVGKSRICFEPEHYEKFKGFPYISGLDIFILDYISPDEEQERKRCKEALFVIAAADAIADGQISADAALKQIRRVEEITGEKVDTRLSGHALRANMYEIAERMMGKFGKNEASELSQLMPWGLKNAKARMPKKYYEEQLRIPFEYMAIPVPTAYDDILKRRYGNYMRVVKGAAGHDYPCFRTQMESMRQTLMEDAPEMVDVMMPTFTYKQRAARGEGAGFKKLLSDALCEMWRMFDCIIATGGNVVGGIVRGIDGNEATIGHDEENGNGSGCENSGESDALSILGDMQQLAVDMGTLIEEVKGEGTECVKSLEALCDSIYILFEQINGSSGVAICEVSDKVNALKNGISETEKLIKLQILERRTVLFLPYKSDYWHSMETYWKKEKEKADTDVIVAPIPYFYKDFYGRLTDEQYSISGYSQEVEVTAYEKLAIELIHPDVIYIQYPYDSYNPVTGILPEHYSSRLVEYTDELIYVPWF